MWLAADYHFPSTDSCRIPMSSMSSAPAMPAPGPATVRLALIRTGIECFGLDAVSDELFPILRSAPVRVRPPERVAISQHVLHGYKWSEDKTKHRTVQESIMVREMAHQWAYDRLSPDPARPRAAATGSITIDRILGAEQFASLLSGSNEVLSSTGRVRTTAR